MHGSLQIYIEGTYEKTQSVVLGGNPSHHRFFVLDKLHLFLDCQSVLLYFWLRLDFSLIVDSRIAKVTYHLPHIM